MAIAAERVRREVGLPTGINVLANAALHALAIARAADAAFIRVNQWANAYVANEGLIEGPAASALAIGNLWRRMRCGFSPTAMSSMAATPSPPTAP